MAPTVLIPAPPTPAPTTPAPTTSFTGCAATYQAENYSSKSASAFKSGAVVMIETDQAYFTVSTANTCKAGSVNVDVKSGAEYNTGSQGNLELILNNNYVSTKNMMPGGSSCVWDNSLSANQCTQNSLWTVTLVGGVNTFKFKKSGSLNNANVDWFRIPAGGSQALTESEPTQHVETATVGNEVASTATGSSATTFIVGASAGAVVMTFVALAYAKVMRQKKEEYDPVSQHDDLRPNEI